MFSPDEIKLKVKAMKFYHNGTKVQIDDR